MNVKYRSWSCQDSQKLQNNASSHYATTIFALCIYFLQYETPLFRIHVFRTRRLIHTPSLSWLQNLNFEFGALRRKKRNYLSLTLNLLSNFIIWVDPNGRLVQYIESSTFELSLRRFFRKFRNSKYTLLG